MRKGNSLMINISIDCTLYLHNVNKPAFRSEPPTVCRCFDSFKQVPNFRYKKTDFRRLLLSIAT